MADDLQKRVIEERALRGGMSVREAAIAGGCANTTWQDWENGGRKLGKAMRRAVAQAFSWEPDWPENPPPSRIKPDENDDPPNGALLDVLERLAVVADDTNAMLRLVAKRQGIRLPAPVSRGPSPRALNAGRRKADRP